MGCMKKIVLFCAMFGLMILWTSPVEAISAVQKDAIVNRCETIREELRDLQHVDSRTRVYLGRYYETILTKFITPLNVRLTENMLSTDSFVNNQNGFVKARTNFTIDFIEYQKGLEDLVAINCKTEPEKFYEKLVAVREKRQIVASDTAKLKKLVNEQLVLVTALKEKL